MRGERGAGGARERALAGDASQRREIARGGVCDSTHQPLVLLLMAIGPDMITKARLGPLSTRAVETLRIIKAVLGVTFNLEEQAATGTVMCTTVGAGIKNIARKAT